MKKNLVESVNYILMFLNLVIKSLFFEKCRYTLGPLILFVFVFPTLMSARCGMCMHRMQIKPARSAPAWHGHCTLFAELTFTSVLTGIVISLIGYSINHVNYTVTIDAYSRGLYLLLYYRRRKLCFFLHFLVCARLYISSGADYVIKF